MDDPERLGRIGRELIEEASNEVLISPVIPWEIALKINHGKMPPHALATDFLNVVAKIGFTPIQIDPLHAIRSAMLPFHHRDPFDRLLAAQSLELAAPIVSKDAVFDRYGVTRIR